MEKANNHNQDNQQFESIEQELAFLREQNQKLRQAQHTGLGMKVSTKGALSVYGLGRFPITLYKSQWATLIDRLPAIQEFIKANGEQLKDKPVKEPVREDEAA